MINFNSNISSFTISTSNPTTRFETQAFKLEGLVTKAMFKDEVIEHQWMAINKYRHTEKLFGGLHQLLVLQKL